MAYAVLTRDPADIAPYAAALAPLGLDVVAMPVTRTAEPADADALRRALHAARYDAVLVTSRRGAEALAGAGTACGSQLPIVYCVGEATRAALVDAGLAASVPAGVHDGASLARAIVAAPPAKPLHVLYPRAADGREEPIAILRAAGWRVDDVIAYRTLPRPAGDPAMARGLELLAAGDAALCAVFAPSQVAALSVTADLADVRTRWLAIGETTAAALRAAGITSVAIATAPTPEGIAKAARAVYRSEP